jgi:hypothetical protein
VNPYGDWRGRIFNSVWTIDFEKDVILLRKQDSLSSAPLRLARDRALTLDDFQPLSCSPSATCLDEQTLPGPFWEPKLNVLPRPKEFITRIIRDFGFAWRHVIRGPMNTTTLRKLAYAIIWILTTEFDLLERTGFEHLAGTGGTYIKVNDLPKWKTPDASIVRAGSSWFVLAQDLQGGIDMVQSHANTQRSNGPSADDCSTYAILTLRQVVLCKAEGNQLKWTKPETLFNDDVPASNTAIDMILWATNTTGTEPPPTRLNVLPVEIQDRVLYFASISPVALGKLGRELGVGSTFPWRDQGEKIGVEGVKRNRTEASPVESRIVFNGVLCGLSYKQGGWHATTKPTVIPLATPLPKFPPSPAVPPLFPRFHPLSG